MWCICVRNVEILGAWDSRLHHSFWCFFLARDVGTPSTEKVQCFEFFLDEERQKERTFCFVWFFYFGRKPCMCKRVMLFFPCEDPHKERKQAGKLFCGLGFREPTRRAKNELSRYY